MGEAKKNFDDRLGNFDSSGISKSGNDPAKENFILVKLNALEKPKLEEGLMNPSDTPPCACNTVCPCVPDQQCACNAVCTCDAVQACSAYCTCVGDCGCDGHVCSAYCPSYTCQYFVSYTPC